MVLLSVCALALLTGCPPPSAVGEDIPGDAFLHAPISHSVELLGDGSRVLIEEVYLNASIEAVWDAYTTEAGWSAWASPVCAIDLRAGGTIQSNYDPEAEIGDAGTNELHIVNFAPLRLLTLRADVSDRWPEVMQHDAENLMNVIIFDDIGPGQTRIQSFGLGYGDAPEYDGLLGFFADANAGLYEDLKRYVEQGVRSDFGLDSE